jgi:hypothetical protein
METILHQSDHFLWITPHPLDAGRTRVKLRLLVPKASKNETLDTLRRDNKDLTYRVQYEDLEIYDAIQAGFASGANQEHCLGTNEEALRQYHDTIDHYIKAR